MVADHLFQTDTTDNILLANQIVTFISTICLIIILIWAILGFRKDKSLCKPLSICCVVSITCFTLFAFIGNIGYTNVLFNISNTSCKVTYSLGLINYNIAKIAMYWLFTLRIEIIFENSSLSFPSKILLIYRILVIIIPSILWSIWIYLSFTDLKPHQINKYSHCFPITFRDSQSASHIAGALAWSDLIFSSIAVFIFVWKLYQVTQLANNNMKDMLITPSIQSVDSKYKRFRQSLLKPTKVSQKWVYTIRKSTVLCIIAILSTWTYVLGTAYILRQCGFFISFDGVINSLCLMCLFKFGDNIYKLSCGKLDKCCVALCCCNYSLREKTNTTPQEILADNAKPSIGGAKFELNGYKQQNEPNLVAKYSTSDDVSQITTGSVGPKSISQNKILHKSYNTIPLKKDDNKDNINVHIIIPLKTPIHNDNEPVFKKAKSEGSAIKLNKKKSPRKRAKSSISGYSESDRSVTFMLLDDMSESGGDDVENDFYDEDNVIQEESELTDTDDEN